ncbi:DNA replication complex GINS family protein [Candidatus Woesearchaeota archaeon]|nr:DNA replication complex GINS family protein [Candidatus Woesearchaeota archaeon]
MEAKEINITYETLFEILKRERDTADLQKLDINFFDDFVDYLNEKKKLLEKEDSLFSYDEKKKVEKQIDNARRIIKDIYERREKKIMGIALIKSRTKSDVMDKSAFLEHEKKLFNEIVRTMDSFRKSIIHNVTLGKKPSETKIENKEMGRDESAGKDAKQDSSTAKLVRFLHSVPKFVGKELEEYGPFEEEDIANLPSEIADLLIGKGRVRES